MSRTTLLLVILWVAALFLAGFLLPSWFLFASLPVSILVGFYFGDRIARDRKVQR